MSSSIFSIRLRGGDCWLRLYTAMEVLWFFLMWWPFRSLRRPTCHTKRHHRKQGCRDALHPWAYFALKIIESSFGQNEAVPSSHFCSRNTARRPRTICIGGREQWWMRHSLKTSPPILSAISMKSRPIGWMNKKNGRVSLKPTCCCFLLVNGRNKYHQKM